MPKPSSHGDPRNEADTVLVQLLFHLGVRLPTCAVTFVFRDWHNVTVQLDASCLPVPPGQGADDDVLGSDNIEKHLEALLAASGKKAPKHGAIRYEMRNRHIRDIEVRLRERQEPE